MANKLDSLINELSVKLEMMRLDSLTFIHEGKMEWIIHTETDEVNPLIATTDYQDMAQFINKLNTTIPLLLRASEDKSKYEEKDFIYY